MSTYRKSRNIEASIIQALNTDIQLDWTGITVEKTFKKVYTIDPPVVCIRVGDTDHNWVEIGTNQTRRVVQVLIDVFGSSDGNRLDLKDYIVSKSKGGFVYNEYVVSGTINSAVANGRLIVTDIQDTPVNFDVDLHTLTPHDRYRHQIVLEVATDNVES